MAKKKKKGLFSKIVVMGVILLNVIFTIVIMALFHEKGTEPSSLIVAWFSFTTVELWSLARIKTAKERKEHDI